VIADASRLRITSELAAAVPGVVVGGLLAVWTFGYRYLSFVEFSNDHFVHLSMAQQITQGALPVRDFVERGCPRYGAHVGAHYHEIGRFGVAVGNDFILMAENGRPSVKSVGSRHLPCFVG
jgi:hypothetical protein